MCLFRAWVVCWDAGQPLSANRALCCHQFKAWFLKVNVLCGGCYGRVSQQKSIQLWQGVLKNISAHFGTGILSYFIFLRRLLHYNILLFLITGLFLVLPQISNPPSSKNKPAATADLWMLTGMGILTDSVMFYGHYANSTNENCKAEIKLCPENYNMPLAYIFTIGAGMFITCVLLVYRFFLWGLCIRNVTLRRRKLEFDIARDVLELIYGQTLVWFGVLFSPLLPAVQIGKLFLLFYFKKTSLMMNFQPPRKHWRATQMSTFFIKLLFFPSFTGALACVIYTMWRVEPSSDCGPFSNLRSMLLLGKKWISGLGKSNPSMLWLSWAYNNLVDNPLFLFITAGLFLAIIYIHMQVLDGQKMIIARLQEQIDNEGEDKKFLIAKLQALNEAGAQQ
uniref:Transmembrane channel-like protein n=1 Tax=Sinocyclocheilus rhinocerous TaxID=307959 RepID=A0A673MCA8_9TELE